MGESGFILSGLGVIAVLITLGRYMMIESQRKEQHKKFLKNMKEYDKKYKN